MSCCFGESQRALCRPREFGEVVIFGLLKIQRARNV